MTCPEAERVLCPKQDGADRPYPAPGRCRRTDQLHLSSSRAGNDLPKSANRLSRVVYRAAVCTPQGSHTGQLACILGMSEPSVSLLRRSKRQISEIGDCARSLPVSPVVHRLSLGSRCSMAWHILAYSSRQPSAAAGSHTRYWRATSCTAAESGMLRLLLNHFTLCAQVWPCVSCFRAPRHDVDGMFCGSRKKRPFSL